MNYSFGDTVLTRRSEGCRLEAYWDATGKVWTIGWGHTGHDVYEGLVWTQAQADAALVADSAAAAAAVNHLVKVPLTQAEFDALVDFVFNEGAGRFAGSTMLRDLNAGDFAGASAEFPKWDISGGVKLAGLLTRRLAEQQEFTSGAVVS